MRKRKSNPGKQIKLTILGLVSFGLFLAFMLRNSDIALFSPKGLIANDQLHLMLFAVAVMSILAIPYLLLFYTFAWRYRENHKTATYATTTKHHTSLVFFIWAAPISVMILLASVMWPATHRLAPQKSISADIKPLTIQVVAMRWKWLFIYPEQNVATVNFVQIPVGKPIKFELTADEAPMNSFWIPHLGGQLYAMTGHVNQLNLIADKAGDYSGRAAEISGKGFTGMNFITRAGSQDDFENWLGKVRASNTILDSSEYQKLLIPSEDNKANFYSETDHHLYANILDKYLGSHSQHTENE